METQKGVYQLISAIVLATILLSGTGLFFWRAGFFNGTTKPVCGAEYVNLCLLENQCKNAGLFWWDESCHVAELKCSETHVQLCATKNTCEDGGFFWWSNNCHLNEQPTPKPSEYPDYSYYLKLEKKINLISNINSWVDENGKVINRQYKKFKVKGEISVAYLFVDVSKGDGDPLTIWDSVYTTLRVGNNKASGGHLFRSYSLDLPNSGRTQLLFDLRQIPYTYIPYSENRNPSTVNWFNLLKNGNYLELETFLSTLQKTGKINNITIGYECAEGFFDCELTPAN